MAIQNPTSNYGWELPVEGASVGTWGALLNAILGDDVTGVDAVIAALDAAAAKLADSNVFGNTQYVEVNSGGAWAARRPGDSNARIFLNSDGSLHAAGNGSATAPVVISSTGVLQNVTANANIITAGTLNDARLSNNVPLLNAANEFSNFQRARRTADNHVAFGGLLAGDTVDRAAIMANGAIRAAGNGTDPAPTIVTAEGVLQNVTLSAALITSGTLADARLSSNVPLLDAASNDFEGFQRVTTESGAPAFAARLEGDTSSRIILRTDGSIDAGGDGSTSPPTVLTAGRVLQNVTANASIITSGTFSADRIPSLSASKITSGTFDTARIPDLATSKITSGEFGVARGGTGRNTLTTGNLLVGAGTSQVSLLAPGAAGGYVRSNGTAWVRSTIQAGDIPNLNASILNAGNLAYARMPTGTGTWNLGSTSNVLTLTGTLNVQGVFRAGLSGISWGLEVNPTPASDATSLLIMINNGQVVTRQVEVGAEGSGGPGYRMLRVLN